MLKRLKSLKIRSKLVAGFFAVALLAGIPGFVSTSGLQSVDAAYSAALEGVESSLSAIGDIMLVVAKENSYVRDISGFGKLEDKNRVVTHLRECEQEYAECYNSIKDMLATEAEIAQYSKIASAYASFAKKQNEVVELGEALDPNSVTQRREVAMAELDIAYDALTSEWALFKQMIVKRSDEISMYLGQRADFFMVVDFIMAFTVMVVAGVVGILISKGVATPIQQCADRLEGLGKGDLVSMVPVSKNQDETGKMLEELGRTVYCLRRIIGDMSRMLQEMSSGNFGTHTTESASYVGAFTELLKAVQRLGADMRETIGKVDVAADHVKASSVQVSSAAQELSRGATKQAEVVEELALTFDSISDKISETAEKAGTMHEYSDKSNAEIKICEEHMNSLMAAMQEMETESREIGNIIKTIEDIAFQTNILALNAAVEAARAGAAGKGFAVVADEVRNLASKSAEASKSTAVLIERARSSVGNGIKVAEETGNSLARLVEDTYALNTLIEDISIAVSNEAGSVAEVTTKMDQIAGIIQTNSATAEETAAASEELSEQAQLMKNLVDQFQTQMQE